MKINSMVKPQKEKGMKQLGVHNLRYYLKKYVGFKKWYVYYISLNKGESYKKMVKVFRKCSFLKTFIMLSYSYRLEYSR